MSHFTSIKTEIKNPKHLLRALADIGFTHVEMYQVPERLYGFEGRLRPESAEVIIRRKYLSSASNDIGFKRQDDGTFEAIISSYDRNYKYSQEWLNRLTQRYGYHTLMDVVQVEGFNVEEEEVLEDGTIRVMVAKWV